ncbi:hypothetical protein [Ketobacter alkanivorans]|uniref:hypothetical protein n=1 Tax=Ketobacter alkanivorans TaxID=1917421 RepID=UPI001315450C|nr:hypothetical protein [Ketobacter alkanivorans]
MAVGSTASHGQPTQIDSLLKLPLEELMNISVTGVGSLTPTKRRHLPASVTRITHNQITASASMPWMWNTARAITGKTS